MGRGWRGVDRGWGKDYVRRIVSLLNLNFAIMEETNVVRLKGAHSRYFELFWPHTKLPLNGRKPENNSLIR